MIWIASTTGLPMIRSQFGSYVLPGGRARLPRLLVQVLSVGDNAVEIEDDGAEVGLSLGRSMS